ncbi:MAG: hypothetical protein IJA81_09140 [Akkermansia sp.]|nr:hypothetical protein [Akkermansia sp.]
MREQTQNDVLLAGDAAVQLESGLIVRPVSFGAMLVFRKMGHPFAGLAAGAELVLTEDHLAQALWVLCAPWEQVRRAVLAGAATVEAAVLDFAAGVSPLQLAEFTEYLAGQKEGIDAATAEVIPEKHTPDTGAKN